MSSDMPSTSTPTTSSTTVEQLQQQVADLKEMVSLLLQQKAASSTSHQPTSLKVAPPEQYDGSPGKAENFLSQLALYFHGKRVENDQDRVITALSYMKGGTAGSWAKLKVKEFSRIQEPEENITWEGFVAEFQEAFGDPDPASTAQFKMEQLAQGSRSADEYITAFKELKDDTGFNDTALVAKFERGLNSALVDKIYGLDHMPHDLAGWMKQASKFDRQWRQREVRKKIAGSLSSKPSSSPFKVFKSTFPSATINQPSQASQPSLQVKQPDVVPMEVDSGWKRITKPIVCFKCRKSGHMARDCQAKYDINSMDYDSLKAYMKEEIEKEKSQIQSKENF